MLNCLCFKCNERQYDILFHSCHALHIILNSHISFGRDRVSGPHGINSRVRSKLLPPRLGRGSWFTHTRPIFPRKGLPWSIPNTNISVEVELEPIQTTGLNASCLWYLHHSTGSDFISVCG